MLVFCIELPFDVYLNLAILLMLKGSSLSVVMSLCVLLAQKVIDLVKNYLQRRQEYEET